VSGVLGQVLQKTVDKAVSWMGNGFIRFGGLGFASLSERQPLWGRTWGFASWSVSVSVSFSGFFECGGIMPSQARYSHT
jgi:hypothetical protein